MQRFQVIALSLSMLMIISMVKGRWLDLETYSNENPLNLRLEISNSSTLHAEQRCKSLYGFFPCADTMREGVFLMFMYMYLMMLGEEWIQKGSEALFLWIGNKALGASVFRVLMALPKIALILVTGVLSSASDAQNQVVLGVSMYAGSTVLTLTIIWGIRIILSRHKLEKGSPPESDHHQDSSIKCLSSLKHKLSFLTDMGVNIDKETGYIAVIMLLSLIPFAFVLLLHFMKNRAMTLFALIVSVVSMLLYFGYQVGHPWIRVRSLAYLKQENLRTRLIYHLQRLAEEDLVDEQGNPKFTCFRGIFDKADKNRDECISHEELEHLVGEVFDLEKDNICKEYAKAEILIHFDRDKNRMISWEEFKQGCTIWLKKLENEANSSGSAFKNIRNQVKIIVINKQRSNLTIIEQIMPRILKQVLEKHGLVKEDGEPDREKIEG